MNVAKVKSVTPKGIQETFDLTIDGDHNFFCNKHLIHNSDYRGPIMVMLINQRPDVFHIEEGTRIAQACVTTKLPYDFYEVETLDETDRGNGGFGSTGYK